MRKLLILLAVAWLSLAVTKAQEPTQPPIIAQYGNKIFAVSPDDGSTRTLVELPPGQTFSWEANQLSPDSTKMLYSVQVDLAEPNAISRIFESLFILDLVDGTSTDLQAKGGVFDRKPEGHLFTLAYRTWSLDGTRVYFTRIELDRDDNLVEVQIIYYDLATQEYHLVMRSDPKRSVPTLTAVQTGVLASWPNDRTWSLHTPDNHTVQIKALTDLYGYIVQYKGQPYYALDDRRGGFSTVINIETGEKKFLGGGYHPAMRSLSTGDQSLITLWSVKDVTVYRMVDNKTTTVQVIPAGSNGIQATLSPDGERVAYLQFNEFRHALLKIMSPDGYSIEFPILADSIVWGSTEAIAFHKPVK